MLEHVVKDIRQNGIPIEWLDILKMQSLYSLEEKGYPKKMFWKKSDVPGADIGIFADEPIKKGEVIRNLVENKNLIVLRGAQDLPPFTKSTSEYIYKYLFSNGDDSSCQLCVPGFSGNHSTNPNMTIDAISDSITHFTACRDIERGEEILLDYTKYGQPPKWLVDFKEDRKLGSIDWEGHNDFVKLIEE